MRVISDLARRALIATAVLLVGYAGDARAGTFAAFGPRTYVRGSTTDTFSVPSASSTFTMRIAGEISSGSVRLNGQRIADSSDFSPKVALIERAVTLTASNTLVVEIKGNPSSTLIVEIVGVDAVPPLVSISDPANLAELSASPAGVQGTATDALSGVAAVTCNG